jgi:choline dehydrogenase-like flavoprotein
VFVDACSVPTNTAVECDICIIGTGAAGITLAREFRGQEFHVCLLEGGGLEFDAATQSLYQGKNTGPHQIELDTERMRYFGGTTNLWGGYCRPLDEEDFEERDWVPNSGWPFRRTELEPYYERAHVLCQLAPFNYDIDAWNSDDKNCFINNGRLVTKFFHLVPTEPDDLRRFGRIYRDDIRTSPNITIYLHANVTNIIQSSDGTSVTNVRIKTISGSEWSVSARIFILATGAIENARLLLLSEDTQNTGIGNAYDLVGRYFLAHLELQAGIFVPSPQTSMRYFQSDDELKAGILDPSSTQYFQKRNDGCRSKKINSGGKAVPILTLCEELRRQHKLVNFTAELEPFSLPLPSGVESFRQLVRSIRDRRMPEDLITQVSRILSDSGNVAAAIYRKMRGEELRVKAYSLTNASETVPNPNSRVTLSRETDQFNRKRVVLNWEISPIDTDSLKRGYEIIGQELGRSGLGRLKLSVSEISHDKGTYWSQHHHMGTTRMHVDPKKGVVNANCQVYGVSNLFIAGSSVFPTSGSATPTLTIIALAIRLADHIKAKMK